MSEHLEEIRHEEANPALEEAIPELYECRARECIELARRSTDTKVRTTFMTMARTWLTLADKQAPPSSHR
jgi:hypothetical protein